MEGRNIDDLPYTAIKDHNFLYLVHEAFFKSNKELLQGLIIQLRRADKDEIFNFLAVIRQCLFDLLQRWSFVYYCIDAFANIS